MELTFEDIDRLVGHSKTLPNRKHIKQLKEFCNWENYYNFLYYLTEIIEPEYCIEIGVQDGLASISMAMASKGWVLGVEQNGINLRTPKKEPQNYIFLNAFSDVEKTFEMVKKITGSRIGIVYQDSSHHYLASKKEWELYSQLLAPGAVWICDDITPAFHDPNVDPMGKGMVQYFEEIPVPEEQKKLYPLSLHFGNTQGIILT